MAEIRKLDLLVLGGNDIDAKGIMSVATVIEMLLGAELA
jgi:hypothetical protein